MKETCIEDIFKKYQNHPDFIGIELVEVNQKGVVDDTMLHIASRQGLIDDMKILIKNQADINVKGDMDNTPLHYACMTGQLDAVRLLLQAKAKIEIKNFFGQTPFDVGILSEFNNILEMER